MRKGGLCRAKEETMLSILSYVSSDKVQPVYNDHPRDPKIVAAVGRWSLSHYHDIMIIIIIIIQNRTSKRRLLLTGDRYSKVVWYNCIRLNYS